MSVLFCVILFYMIFLGLRCRFGRHRADVHRTSCALAFSLTRVRKHWWNGHPLAVLRLTEDWWCRYALMCGSERELIIALPESFPELYDPDQLLTVRLSERMRK